MTDLELVLNGLGAHGYNLLEPKGMWHGIQPFVFAGLEFGRDGPSWAYGKLRRFKVERLGMEVRIKVVGVHVSRTRAGPSGDPDYQLDDLTLDVTLQRPGRDRSD